MAKVKTSKKLRPLRVKAKEKAGKITTAGRRALSKGQFALPDGNKPGVKGRYPIHDISHARNALARVSAHGTSSEKARVRAAVYRKYPTLKPAKKAKKKK